MNFLAINNDQNDDDDDDDDDDDGNLQFAARIPELKSDK